MSKSGRAGQHAPVIRLLAVSDYASADYFGAAALIMSL